MLSFASLSLLPLAAEAAPGFKSFTPAHFWTVVVCAIFMAAMIWRGRALQAQGGVAAELRWRRIYGGLCLLAAIFSIIWYLLPQNFDWEVSLPLQFCDIAPFVAAAVLFWSTPCLRGLLYFWTVVFTLNAFITPIVSAPPASVEFVLFWMAHTVILGPAVYDLVIRKFRPTWCDTVRSYSISLFYAGVLFVLDRATGWNYGFVGPSKPSAPTMVDLLGPYPLRVVWMTLIATIGFILAWLPWGLVRVTKRKKSWPAIANK